MMKLAIVVVALFAILQTTAAVTTHVVGDSTGWALPTGNPTFYAVWAARQTFVLGDILFFNFTTGQHDVARVTAGAFLICNSTNPISLNTTGPVNITLNSTGAYYFIDTLNNNNNCNQGQKLAINVTTAPGPVPTPVPRTTPENLTVGEGLGWIIPPLGEITYLAWARNRTFIVGDTLVFNFRNGSDDVVEVTKDAYDLCNTSISSALYNNSPAHITLRTTGEYFFTSTYNYHCELGQKLAINVTDSTGSSPSTPGTANSPASPPSVGAAPSRTSSSYLFILSTLAMAAFY